MKSSMFFANYLLKNSEINITIIGHTDANGEDDYNFTLSVKRADAVKKYLIQKGVAKSRITTKGEGEKQPIAPNTDEKGNDYPKGRQLNRRVEFILN
ncbi:MAG: OmpA family protein [Flavobacteriales bacterium]|nr:OmpA family protein [Flavobacteriales bacterium]